MNKVHQISEQINNFFDANTISELMKNYGVIKRKREIEPSALIKTLLKQSLKSESSIADVVETLYHDDNIIISRSAILKQI